MQTCKDILSIRRSKTNPFLSETSHNIQIPFPTNPNSYTLLHEIGRGVSAIVYKATCLPLPSIPLAIKSINLDRTPSHALDQYHNEAKSMSLLSHPNILRAHCSFVVGNFLWVVMPLMSAGSMQLILDSSFPGGLAEGVVAYVLRDVLKALCYLHEQGHVHRDVKAGNVLVGGDGCVKLADFGVSASIYDGFCSSTLREIAGTPCWMAPEVIHSHVGYGIKADIWSFGITALELAYGRPPLSHLPPSKSLLVRVTSRLWLHDAKKFYTGKKKLSKLFRQMVAACLAQHPSARPSADKLLRHSFFKNCRSQDYFVKTILRAMPPLEMQLKMNTEINDEGIITPKSRRVSGWNFCEDEIEVVSVFAKESLDNEEKNKKDNEEDNDQEKKVVEPYNMKKLVPQLFTLLGSLEKQREMLVNILENCGRLVEGCEEKMREEKEKWMVEFVKLLQKTVDELSLELQREKNKNVALQEKLERVVVERSCEE